MRLVVIRESDNETFEISSEVYGSYVLDSMAVIPGGGSLEISGYEYSGRDGGYATAARQQRRGWSLPFTVKEDHTTTTGLFGLIREARGFFISHDSATLEPDYFTVEFYTNDREETSFQLRHGTISVGFNARAEKGESIARANVSFIFGDPYLYPIGDSGLTFRLYAGGQNPGTPEGRMWSATDGAEWTTADGKTWVTAGGSGDPVAVDVISIATVPVSIVSSGQLIDPQIVNLTDGSSFTYDGTLGAGDVLTVDTSGTVLVNGVAPPDPYYGTLTAQNGSNTFVMLAPPGSPGYVDLTILGAF